jgi:hypothetical protein
MTCSTGRMIKGEFMSRGKAGIPTRVIERCIFVIRGERVMLDYHLAKLYGVGTKRIIEAVKRNSERFPDDFAFQLTNQEVIALRSQFATSNVQHLDMLGDLQTAETARENEEIQQVTDKGFRSRIGQGRGGRRRNPYVFTEEGVAMLSSVLNAPRAVSVNVEIMRVFVRMRRMIASNENLTKKLDTLEQKYDQQFKVVFDAIRELMKPAALPKRRIGF